MTTQHNNQGAAPDAPQFLGVDVAKDSIEAHLLPSGRTWRVERSETALAAWAQTLPETIALVVLEATGGLHTRVVAALAERGLPVSAVNPQRARQFALSAGLLAKTDRVDAYALALMGQTLRPTAQPMKDADQQALEELMARRRQLVEMLAAEKNRLQQTENHQVRVSIGRVMAALARQIKRLDKELDGMIKASPLWREQEERLTSVKGVGKGTARMIAAALPELGRLTRRQIAALAGVAPFARQSGGWRGRSACSGGRGAVRAMLYMAALSAAKHNPVIKPFYERLIARGKPFKVAITACMHKLLTILNAMVKTGTRWGENLA